MLYAYLPKGYFFQTLIQPWTHTNFYTCNTLWKEHWRKLITIKHKTERRVKKNKMASIIISVQDFEELSQNITIPELFHQRHLLYYNNGRGLWEPTSPMIKFKNYGHMDTDNTLGHCAIYFNNIEGNRLRKTQCASFSKVEVFLRVTDPCNTPPMTGADLE